MNSFNSILFLCMSSTIFIINQGVKWKNPKYANFMSLVVAVNVEGLLGGKLADPHKLTYQVAIVHKKSEKSEAKLSCSGGIIAKNLILTIATCFLNSRGLLKLYEYSILVDTINWKNEGNLHLIEQIFLPARGYYTLNNIAVASLINDLDVDNNPYLSVLSIPEYDEWPYGKIGIVSGYGYSYIHYDVDLTSSFREQVHSVTGSDHFLRYADVLVSLTTRCSVNYPEFNDTNHFCGIMLANISNPQPWGLCKHDGGSPLVINDKIIGLGNRIHYNCDDTNYGSGYIKVSAYAPFINAIINNDPLLHANVFKNTIHSQFLIAPAA